jgi:uncharacterized membrane protein (Fun14 family)
MSYPFSHVTIFVSVVAYRKPSSMALIKVKTQPQQIIHEIPFAGSGLVGYAISFALKKILKSKLIVIGFLPGVFFPVRRSN